MIVSSIKSSTLIILAIYAWPLDAEVARQDQQTIAGESDAAEHALRGSDILATRVSDSGRGAEFNFIQGFESISSKQLSLELTWDNGGDLDIHLRHPKASDWFDTIWVCFWQNHNPDWGAAGNNSDDPSLDVDDINGFGPEVINFAGLESNVVYQVGANYWNAYDFGAAVPSIKVFWDGKLVHELSGSALADSGYFWQAVDIERVGENLSITEIDTITSSPP